ncbi:MAG: hypothetical protein JKY53_14635 [Flavobacteriales bacterium]|nr:hypothetical protein [Flavobacteriales bacterium]
MILSIINLQDYTIPEHILFFTGCLGWVIAYVLVIKAIFKEQFIEIPVFALCANFAWEFLWSFVFKTDMGELYVWGYRIWFVLDCVIVYGMFKYGWKQWRDQKLVKHYKFLIAFCLVCWFAVLYTYIGKWDLPITHMGANSGYILNVMMSLMYPILLLKMSTTKGFSYVAGWCKGVGTLLISVFCSLKFGDHYWLLTLCVITSILDGWYLVIFTKKRKELVTV